MTVCVPAELITRTLNEDLSCMTQQQDGMPLGRTSHTECRCSWLAHANGNAYNGDTDRCRFKTHLADMEIQSLCGSGPYRLRNVLQLCSCC